MRASLVRFVFICLLASLSSPSAIAASHYIRAAATGANNGTSWTDAWTTVPSVMVRGDTYYIAGGTYGIPNFNDAASGGTLITVKHATLADHGTATGWSDSYTNQTVFVNSLYILTSNWLIDGGTGGGPGAWTNGFGFKFAVTSASSGPGVAWGFSSSDTLTNVTLRHFEVQGNGGDGDNAGNTENDGLVVHDRASDNLIEYGWVHDMGRTILFNGSDRNTYRYLYTGRYESTPGQHSEIVSAYRGAENLHLVSNVTFENCVFSYIDGTGGLIYDGSYLTVYGCVFYRPTGLSFYGGNGAIGSWSVGAINYASIYNNTFMDLTGGNGYVRPFGTQGTFANWSCRNNLFYACDVSYNPGSSDYNFFASCVNTPTQAHSVTTSGNPISAWQSFNWTPDAATAAGTSLPSPYNVDPNGVTRGSDGTWDRGAYEYTGGSPPPAYGSFLFDASSYSVSQSGGSVTVTVTRINGSDGAVGVTLATADDSAVAGHDYTGVSTNLAWSAADASTLSVSIPILASGDTATTNRAFTVSLSAPTGGATLASPNSVTVTIVMPAPPPAPVPQVGLTFYATDMLMLTPFVANATGVYQSVNTLSTNGAGALLADVVFTNAAATDYRLQLEVQAAQLYQNSFFIDFLGTNDICDLLPITSGVESRWANYRGSGDGDNPEHQPMTWTISGPSTNRLIIFGREASTILSNLTFVASVPPPPPPQLYFAASAFEVTDAQTLVYVEIQRSSTDVVSSVDLVTANATAIGGIDYENFSQVISFGIGTASASIPIGILPRPGFQGARSFIVTLSNPVNAELYDPSMATVNILDYAQPTGNLNIHNLRTNRIKVR